MSNGSHEPYNRAKESYSSVLHLSNQRIGRRNNNTNISIEFDGKFRLSSKNIKSMQRMRQSGSQWLTRVKPSIQIDDLKKQILFNAYNQQNQSRSQSTLFTKKQEAYLKALVYNQQS